MFNQDYTYPSSILDISYLNEIDNSFKFIKQYVANLVENPKGSSYLLWCLKRNKYKLTEIRDYVTQNISIINEFYTISDVLYEDQISKFCFLFVFIPHNKTNEITDSDNSQNANTNDKDSEERLLLDYLKLNQFDNCKKVDLTSSIYETMESLFTENQMYFESKGIVSKSFESILQGINNSFAKRNIRDASLFPILLDLTIRYSKNNELRKQLEQFCSLEFLDNKYLLLYPYFNVRIRYGCIPYPQYSKSLAIKRNQMFKDLLGIEDDTEQNDFKFRAKFIPLQISNKESDEYDDLESLCIPPFRSTYIEEVKKREIQMPKFLDCLNLGSDLNKIINKTIKYDPAYDYKSFFTNEEIKPHLVTDPINENFTNLEYFFYVISMFAHRINVEEFIFEYEIISKSDRKKVNIKYSLNIKKQDKPSELSYLVFHDIRYHFVRWSLYHYSVVPFLKNTYEVSSYSIM